jgi:hypothetical protein
MNTIRCASCGQDNSSTQVYCAHCGSILPKAPLKDGDEPLPTSVAVAARRVQRVENDSDQKQSLFSHLVGILRYLLSVALTVSAVLALMDPKAPLPESQVVSNAPAVLRHLIVGSRGVQVTIAQPLINQALAQGGRIQWKAPLDFIPLPEWVGASVMLSAGGLSASVTLTFLNYPLHFSESFRLSGGPLQWNLTPESASVGLLPLRGPLLNLITPFMRSCASPFTQELQMMKGAELLRIRPGFVDLSSRP